MRITKMKKIIVALTVMSIMVGSLATVCLAAYVPHTIKSTGFNNRFNGSYYYDIGWCKTKTDEGYRSEVTVGLYKDGRWQAYNTTKVHGGSTLTCYSQKIQGSGSEGLYYSVSDYID